MLRYDAKYVGSESRTNCQLKRIGLFWHGILVPKNYAIVVMSDSEDGDKEIDNAIDIMMKCGYKVFIVEPFNGGKHTVKPMGDVKG